MKKILIPTILVLSILVFNACFAEKQKVRYGGTDVNGLTADAVISKCYEYFKTKDFEKAKEYTLNKSIFDEKTELISLDKCFIVEFYEPDELDEWCKDAFAYCVVQTSAEILCKESCAYGNKGDNVVVKFAYYLVMNDEKSSWRISDYGYPPVTEN